MYVDRPPAGFMVSRCESVYDVVDKLNVVKDRHHDTRGEECILLLKKVIVNGELSKVMS
jgi:hypothetical protein